MTRPSPDQAAGPPDDRRASARADQGDQGNADQGEAPALLAGDDVRVGPDDSDKPEAGAAEPPD